MIDSIANPEPGPVSTSSVFHGVRLSIRIRPAALADGGGDWCEAFVVPGDIIALSIGDVCGHGEENVAAMAGVRQAIRDAVFCGLDPAQTLTKANRFLRRYDQQEYATATLALLNTRRRSIVFANAGHPPPLVTGPGGTAFLEFPDCDLPLGIEADLVPALHQVRIPAATLLVLYTDGVSEHERKPLSGAAQLRAAAIFVYKHKRSTLHTATVIEEQMLLTGSNHDDVAILTAWMPSASLAHDSDGAGPEHDSTLKRKPAYHPHPTDSIVKKDDRESKRQFRRQAAVVGRRGERSDAQADQAGVMIGAVPESDPAYPIVRAILQVVPASRWAFARVEADGDLNRLLASEENGGQLDRLRSEFQRQRVAVKTGPRMAAALGPLGDFESGVTLLFADARKTFGILTLLRTAALGPFTSSEISMLAFALSAASDQLSALHLQPLEADGASRRAVEERLQPSSSPETAFYVLDQDLEIVLAWNSDEQRRVALTGLRTQAAERLPAVLEETVRELTAGWGIEPSDQPAGSARPVPFLVVRTQPLSGPTGLFIGVRIDRFQPPNSLTGAAERFHISPREVQVLALLLDGTHLEEIGRRLHITSSTVQDHIRSMVEKTGSRNRSELIARVLGWESTPGTASA